MLNTLWSARQLLWELVRREVRARTIGSVGGRMWLLARPLLTVLAYLFIFDLVFKVRLGEGAAGASFGLFLLTGLLPWIAFTEAVNSGTTSLLEASHLLKKTALPLELFPARAVLSGAVLYAPVVSLYALGTMLARTSVDWALLVPLWFGVQVLFSYLIAINLALLAAAMRDVVQMVTLVTGLWIFVSPVFFPMERVAEGFGMLVWCNPGTPLVLGYHAMVLHGELPDLTVLAATLAWILFLAGAGRLLLRRTREQVVDWL